MRDRQYTTKHQPSYPSLESRVCENLRRCRPWKRPAPDVRRYIAELNEGYKDAIT